MAKVKICLYCGKPIKNPKPQQKYHLECGVTVGRERRHADYIAQRDLKSTCKICKRCGKPIENPCRNQKYHPECAKIVHDERVKRYEAKRLAKKKKARNAPLSIGEISVLMKQYGYGNDYARFVHDYHGKIKGV